MSPSGKASAFGADIRGFESLHPSQIKQRPLWSLFYSQSLDEKLQFDDYLLMFTNCPNEGILYLNQSKGYVLEIINNMWRRKVRTLLTVFGIAIGILALVVMGSMAEKLNLQAEGGVNYYQDKIQVSSDTSSMLPAPLRISTSDEIAKISGVEYVSPIIRTPLEKSTSAFSIGNDPTITAIDQNAYKHGKYYLSIYVGRQLSNDDTGKAIVGYDLVTKLGADLGRNITIRGRQFEVIGIWEKTYSDTDTSVSVSLKDGQSIIYDDLPEIVKSNIRPSDISTGFVVYSTSGTDPNELASLIQKTIPGTVALGPKQFQDQTMDSVNMVNSIIYAVAIVSLIVGSLSIINTMTMSVGERTKEIGVKKAIGAKTGAILREYMLEAGVIGLIGGVVGVIIGIVASNVLNIVMKATGDELFLVTPRLVIGSIIFSIVLGIIAGFMPAMYATRISIVKALREG